MVYCNTKYTETLCVVAMDILLFTVNLSENSKIL